MKTYFVSFFFLTLIVACGEQHSNQPSEVAQSSRAVINQQRQVSFPNSSSPNAEIVEDEAEIEEDSDSDFEDMEEERSPEESDVWALYNVCKANFKNTMLADIQKIEDFDEQEFKLADFMSSDARLHDVRGKVSNVVVCRIKTDSVYNYKEEDLDLKDERVFSYMTEHCAFEDYVPITTFSFDLNGKAIYMPLVDQGSNWVTWVSKRNDAGQLVSFVLDEKYGYGADITFWYGRNGMLDSMDYRGMTHDLTTYKYDNLLNLVSSHSKWSGSSETQGDDYVSYKIAKRDRFGNWIKRYKNITKEDRSEGEYHVFLNYEIEYRKIQYRDE